MPYFVFGRLAPSHGFPFLELGFLLLLLPHGLPDGLLGFLLLPDPFLLLQLLDTRQWSIVVREYQREYEIETNTKCNIFSKIFVLVKFYIATWFDTSW